MTSDPYSKLIQQMKKQGQSVNTPAIQIGQVISTYPLTIRIGDLQIDKDNILMADYLLSGYTRKSNLTIGSGTITFTDTLNNNDRLAILPTEDKQLYIVLARVVRI